MRLRLRAKAVLTIVGIVSAFLAGSALVTDRRMRTVAAEGRATGLEAGFRRYLREIDSFTDGQSSKAATLAHLGEWLCRLKRSDSTLDTRAAVMDVALANLRGSRDAAIIGNGLWYEPYAIDEAIRWVGPYAVVGDTGAVSPTWEYSNDAYAYTTHDWYTMAVPAGWNRSLRRPQDHFMSEPYLDSLGGRPTIFVTSSHVMYSPEGRIIGVATADWTLDSLAATLEQFRPTPNSFVVLIHEPTGRVLFPAGSERLQQVRDTRWGRNVELTERATIRLARVDDVVIDGRRFDVLYTRTHAGFVLGLFVATDEAYAVLDQIAYDNALLALITLLLVVLATVWAIAKLLEPIRTLADSARLIAAGDFDHRAGVTTSDEIGDLATAFNEAYRHVRESEERFRALIENASDIIAIVDRNGVIRYASPSVARVLGYEAEALIGKPIAAIVHEEDLAAAERAVERGATEDGGSELFEGRVRHIDGSYRTLETIGARMHSSSSSGSIVLNARDVTERRAADAALKRSEEQLRQAQKLEAVGRLAGGVAHDFNNAMTAVLVHTQLLMRKRRDDRELCDELGEIRAAGEHASALTRQLLTFSRHGGSEPEAIDLSEVVFGVEKMLGRLIGENLELDTELGKSLPAIYADRRQIEQVIVNLVVNARDAMESGGTIRVSTRYEETLARRSAINGIQEPGKYVSLTVEDTGIGMDEATLSHVFDPFFTTKDLGHGTGLGLSTVYGIVEESHGCIVVESQKGRGTRFTIAWPLTAITRSKTVRESTPPRGSRGDVVLVVEDDVRVRAVTAAALRASDFRTIEAEGPDAALALVTEGAAVDVLVTDVVMPKITGPELAKRIEILRPGLPVLFVSGYAAGELKDINKLGPRRAFLCKPFTPSQLVDAVHALLAEAREPEVGAESGGQIAG